MNNTIWLIISGVLILMAIIGYTVEKNSGKEKKIEKEDSSDKKEKIVKKEIKNETPQIELSEKNDENIDENNISMMELDTIPTPETMIPSTPLEQTEEMVASKEADVTVPLETNIEPTVESAEKLDDFALNDISTLFEEPKAVETDANDISALVEEPKIAETDANDISTLFGEPKPEETDANDVWKF